MAEEIKRDYTIPLRRGYANTPRYKRTHKAVRVLKEFLIQHFKTEDIKIGKHLNEFIWRHGIKNPPPRVKVTAVVDKDGVVKVELQGKEYVEFKALEKTERNQSFQEKLKSKVSTAKTGEEPKSEVETKAEKTVETKTETTKKSTPAKKPVEAKPKPVTTEKKTETSKPKSLVDEKVTPAKPSTETPKKSEEKVVEKKAE